MKVSNYFKDSSGNIVITQWPNWQIWTILGASALERLFEKVGRITYPLISFMLFYWGFLELTRGESGFRRTLGAIALGYSAWRLVK